MTLLDPINAANGLKGDPDRLYVLLPHVYRQRDAESGFTLRALLRVITEQVEMLEDDISRLYENWFIETCDDWVVPYIGELVGMPMSPSCCPEANPRLGETAGETDARARSRARRLMPRAQVADWIRSLKRKGTLSLLEEITRTAAGWPARAVEFYPLLGWCQHPNHPRPGRGGTIDLRDGAMLAWIDSPFDSAAHTVDIRRPGSPQTSGRHNLPSIGLFLWRLRPYTVTDSPAYRVEEVGSPGYRFSVLGSDCVLFHQPKRGPEEAEIPAEPTVLPIRITRRMLEQRFTNPQGRILGVASSDYYGEGGSIAVYAPNWPVRNAPQPVPPDRILVTDLSDWHYVPPRGYVSLDPETGRLLFPARQAPPGDVRVRYAYGFSADMGGGEYPRVLTQPDHARFYRVAKRAGGTEVTPPIFDSITAALDRWRTDRDADQTRIGDETRPLTPLEEERKRRPAAVIEIEDSDEYTERFEIRLIAAESLVLRAADGTRPVLRLLDYRANRSDALRVSGGAAGRFTLDGLWVIGRGLVIDGTVDEETNGDAINGEETGAESSEVTGYESRDESNAGTGDASGKDIAGGCNGEPHDGDGSYDPGFSPGDTRRTGGSCGEPENWPGSSEGLCEVRLRDCTLVPGWGLDPDCDPRFPNEPSIELVDTGARLVVERSILGSIRVSVAETRREPVAIDLTDSILDATSTTLPALESPAYSPLARARLTVRRCTIFGTVGVHAVILAENTLFCGDLTVARRQEGCLRFCYVPYGSRTPRRFQCQPDGVSAGLSERDAAFERERVAPAFTSTRYGTPGYAQLPRDCAPEITRGADDESEMGAFHDMYSPQRETLLRRRIDEFTPEDRDAGLIYID